MAEEVMCMDNHAIIRNLPNGTWTRQQILHAAQIVEPSFKETQLRYVIGTLLDSGLMERVGRNQYKKVGEEGKKRIFTGIDRKSTRLNSSHL